MENWEACSLPSALRLTYCQVSYTLLVCSLDPKHKGKGMWYESQQRGGELRDDTKNGCVADYAQSSMRQCLLSVVFNPWLCLQNNVFFIFKLEV